MIALRRALFGDPLNAALSLLILAVLALTLPPLVDWALLKARFAPDVAACEALERSGACWGVVTEKARFIVLGRYPSEQGWRPALAAGLIAGSWVAAASGWLRGRAAGAGEHVARRPRRCPGAGRQPCPGR